VAVTGTDVRGRILNAVSSKPGIHMRELGRTVGLSLSGVGHHLRVLEEEGLVVGLSDGYYRRFFPSHLVLEPEARRLDNADRRLLAECRRTPSLAIILSLAVDGPLTHREIGHRLRKSKGTVSYHLSRLVDAGLVNMGRGSAEGTYELADPKRAVSVLVTFSPSLRDRLDGFARLWLALRP